MGKMLGEVDLFGLNEFGNNPGMSEWRGALIGAAVPVIARAIAQRTSMLSSLGSPDTVAVVAGVVASGGLWLNKKTRNAGVYAGAVTAITAVLPWLLNKMSPLNGLGIPQIEYLNGLGIPQVEYLNGAGLGMPGIAPVPPSYGTIPGVYGSGIAGPQLGQGHPPVDLLGERTAVNNQVDLMGGPTLSGLAQSYGASLLGRN